MNIKSFSHNDNDGYSCTNIIREAYKQDKVDFECCGVYKFQDIFLNFLKNKEYKKYNIVYVTDISFNKKIAEAVNNLDINICLLDHHKSALFLNKYVWATVKIDINGEQTCATELIFNKLKNKIDKNILLNVTKYVEEVKRYDTFLWKKYKDTDSIKLNLLFDSLGGQGYYDILKKYKYNIPNILKNNSWMLQCFINKKNEFINMKLNEKILVKNLHVLNNTYSAGIIYASKYISLLGYELLNKYNNLDLIVIINGTQISFRTNKDYVDCQLIAKNYNNGGGHKKASGTSISVKQQYNFLNKILS